MGMEGDLPFEPAEAELGKVPKDSTAFCEASEIEASKVVGIYSKTHEIFVLDEEGLWVSASVSDSLHLDIHPDGGLSFRFILIQTNGHSCSMEGVAREKNGYWEYREPVFDDSTSEDGECILRLRFSESEIWLQDLGNHCRSNYCGQRAGIDGVRFGREGVRQSDGE